MEMMGTSQSELSRLTGVPQSKISRYVTGRLEPSVPMFNLLLSSLGVQVSFDVSLVRMERTKLRSWMLHRAVSRKLVDVGDKDWERLSRNLEHVRLATRGQPHERNIDRWQVIIDGRDVRGLRRVLVDTSTDGIEMREVSPVTGFLSDEERMRVLKEVPR
jgi:transcriptional regulator with XRE-family HTH domain